jgi:hypothetical protein
MDPTLAQAESDTTAPDAVVMHHDLYADAAEEMARDQWIECEKAGCDLGEHTKHKWLDKHWPGYIRSKLLEHLHGRRCWSEFDIKDFGLLNREFKDDKVLLDLIVDRLRAGQENLNIIAWAYEFNLPIERVHKILLAININRCRMVCSLSQVNKSA